MTVGVMEVPAAQARSADEARATARLGAATAPGERIRSIDVLRGLTILVMIFVNDVAGVHGTPGWMKHIEPPASDGMTFVDVVFPAFLFIVGLSIPMALERRLARGTLAATIGHVLARTLGLLVLGVFMVNAGSASPDGLLPPPLWSLLVYLAAMLVWVAVPVDAKLGPKARAGIRLGGAAALLALALLFRGKGPPALIELHHSWWGILGLIGWAYAVSAAVYLLFRANVPALIGGVVLLYAVYIADAADAFAGLTPVTDWVSIGSMLGSHAALTLSGVVFGAILLPSSSARTHAARLRWGVAYGAFLFAAAWLVHSAADLHDMFIVNKIAATPAWCLYCAAITIWIWAALYWLLDVRKSGRWASMLEGAGQNALLAYILAPIAYDIFELAAKGLGVTNYYGALGDGFAPGFVRALLFATALTWAAALARRKGLVLRL